MFGSRMPKPEVTVSIEASARTLTVLRTRTGGGLPAIEACERRALPPPGEAARASALETHLRELAPIVKSGKAEVRLVVDTPSVMLRGLHLPRMPFSEVLASVRLQWPHMTQTPFEEMRVDLHCARSRNPRSPGMSVLVAAMPKDTLEEMLSPLRAAGLAADAVIPGALALWMLRNAEIGPREASPSVEAILDIGLTRSCLVLGRGEQVHAARDIPTAGHSFTQILSRELDVPLDEAEKLKREHGVADSPEARSDGERASTLRSIHAVLRPVVERLAAEVQRSIAFLQEERAEERPARLLLTGGGARLPGLAERMAELLDVAVEIWDPARRIDVATVAEAPARAEAEGVGAMCLGGAAGRPLVNLLAPSRAASGARRLETSPALFAGAYVLLLAAIVGWFWNGERQMAKQVAAQEARIARMPVATRNALALGPYLQARGREQADYKRLFEELYWLVPEEVSLEAMTLKRPASPAGNAPRLPRVLQIEGVAGGPVIDSERTLAQLLEAIEDSPIIRNVQLVRSAGVRDPEERGLRFAFTCEVDGSGMAGARSAADGRDPEERR